MNKTEIYYAQLHNTECSYKLHVIEEINSLKNCDKNECQYKRNTYEYKHSKGWLYGSGHCCVLRTFNRLQEYPYMYSYVAHAITAAVFTVAVAAAETASLVTDNLYSSLLTNDNDEETLNINNKTYILATSAPTAASYTYSSFTTTTTPLEAFNISFGNLNEAAIIASTTQSVASLSSTSAVNITADSIQLDINVSLTSSTSLSSSTDDWSHFYDLVFSWQGVCLIAVFCAFIVITIIGNTLVILAVITTRRLKTVTNCFVMSLAVADLLVGIFVMPPAVAVHLIGSWQLGWVLCDIWISLDVLLCTASILSLCAISVDRYLAVTQPLTYSRKRRSKRLALIMILIVWILALAITCPPILGWYEPGRRDLNECRYNQNEGYVIFSAMGSFFIPMAVMIYVYARISCVIANRHDNMTDISVHNKKFKRYTAADIDNELDADLSEFDIQTTQRTQPPEKTLSNQILAKDLHDIMASDNKISSAMQCHSLLVLQQQTTNSPNSKNGCYEMKRSDSLKRSSTASSVTTTMTSTTCTGTAGVAMDNPWTFTPTNNQQQQQQHHTHYQQHAHPNKQMRTHSVRHQHSTGAGHVTPSPGHNITPDAIITESGASILRPNIPQLRSHQHSHHYTTKSLSNRISSLKKETKTTQTLSIVVGGFIACWLPFFINYLITPFLDEDQVSSTLAKVLTWLGWFNSAINPFIYAFYSVDFRAAFWRLTCKRFFSSTTKPQFPTNTMSIRR